eukprot:1070149-Prorocentrum_minimum.AAC.1
MPRWAQGFNKWQNGFVSRADGCVYAIPCNAQYVLRIDPFHEEGAHSQVHRPPAPTCLYIFNMFKTKASQLCGDPQRPRLSLPPYEQRRYTYGQY